MNVTIEKTRYECSSLPKRWQHHQHQHQQQPSAAAAAAAAATATPAAAAAKPAATSASAPAGASAPSSTPAKPDVVYYNRGARSDASLVPPIRQTASIFKQPVTVHKTQESKVKADVKHGAQEKPKQLMWEKRLEGLRACDPDGTQYEGMELPRGLRPVGPNVVEETIIQSVATALHVSSQPVTGQTGPRTSLDKNPGVFLDPKQPLVQAVNVSEEDIKRQEERVVAARRKLQEALKATC